MLKKNKNLTGIIYLVTNKKNNKKYIGATTKNIALRMQDHIQKSNTGAGYDFQHAIWTYGADNFNWIEVDTATSVTELAQKERYYIEKYDSFNNGYNSDRGGGFKKPIYQYTLIGELVNTFDCLKDAALSIGSTKKTISKTCLSVNKIFDGYLWGFNYMEPYVLKNKDKRFKEVEQFVTDGIFINKFKSIAEASRSTGICKSSIAKVCRNKRKTAGGFVFKFFQEKSNYNSSSNSFFPIPQIKESRNYTINSTNLSIISSSSIYPIYYTRCNSTIDDVVYSCKSTGTEELTQQEKQEIYTRYAPLFRKPDVIWIPKRVLTDLRRNIPKILLDNINKNRELAIEMCLLFLSNLTSTFYTDRTEWKQLSSKMIHKQLKYKEDNTWNYPSVIKALKYGTKKYGPFIEVKKDKKGIEIYKFKKCTKKFRLASAYLKHNIVEYQIKEDFLRKRKLDFSFNRIIGAYQNVICNNLINVYPTITYPSIEDIMIEAKRIIKSRKPLKKGKFLTFRNKHSNSHWKSYKKRSFVEDHIKQFKMLTEKGLKIPFPGTTKSGGRVVDSLTLMPSWIRAMCKIKGKRIWEVDYSTLHPNIAMNIYDGSERNINHDEVADYLGISRNEAKIEHLSFFNKHWEQMRKSPLFKYYMKNEPILMANIKRDKYNSVYKHKITSRKLFKVEVEIMTKAIEELNNMNIYVIYVYDALYCEPKFKDVVRLVMNKVVKEIGVNTSVPNKNN